MKKNLIAPIVILVLIGAGALVLLASKDNKTEPEDAISQTTQMTDGETPSPANQSAGAYVNYSENIIAATSGTKLLFFHAPWCPQCRDLEEDILSKGVPAGVTIVKVDYDSNQALKKKYGVTLQTTFVKVDDQGELIDKFVAYDDPTLKAVADKLL